MFLCGLIVSLNCVQLAICTNVYLTIISVCTKQKLSRPVAVSVGFPYF